MAVHNLTSGRPMPWQHGEVPRGAAPPAFTEAELVALRRLEAELSRSMEGAAPRRGDPLLQLTEVLIIALERKRARCAAPGRSAGAIGSPKRRPFQAMEHRIPPAVAGGSRLGDLLRDVERQLAPSPARAGWPAAGI